MANEFIIKNGFKSQGTSNITGSLIVSGSLLVAGLNPTPRTGSVRDGVTSVLGDLQNWNSNYYSGEVLFSEIAGETIAFGQVCYRDRFGNWLKAVGDVIGEPATNMLGICLYPASVDNPTSILTRGYVETTYTDGGSNGVPLFIRNSPGVSGYITSTAPSSAGNVVRIVGYMFWDAGFQTNSVTIIHFNPDNTWIEL